MTNIKINKTAVVETWGNPQAKNVLVVLHGYGQLVRYFIRKFHSLDENNVFVIAPEGLHRFYLRGASGRVGASWMTKEERDSDIDDYIHYLNEVCAKFNLNSFENRTLLGFSQGGATASRWHEKGDYLAQQFILWGSVFPEDVELPNQNVKFSASKNHFFIGSEDEYYPEEAQKRIIEQINYLDLNFEICKYSGRHDIVLEELQAVLSFNE